MIRLGFESDRDREEVYTTLAIIIIGAILAVGVLAWLTPNGASLLTGLSS
jgi:hypothetical protein